MLPVNSRRKLGIRSDATAPAFSEEEEDDSVASGMDVSFLAPDSESEILDVVFLTHII
jgi:hypothetical protein